MTHSFPTRSSSDLVQLTRRDPGEPAARRPGQRQHLVPGLLQHPHRGQAARGREVLGERVGPEQDLWTGAGARQLQDVDGPAAPRSEEHTSELQSTMRNSYAVFCLKKQQYPK